MTDGTDNLVLEHLRRIRASQDRMEADVVGIKHRLFAVEQHGGQFQIQLGVLNVPLDRMDERLSRIERRLDPVEV